MVSTRTKWARLTARSVLWVLTFPWRTILAHVPLTVGRAQPPPNMVKKLSMYVGPSNDGISNDGCNF